MNKSFSFNNRLGWRVLVYILLCSSLLSLAATFFQLYGEFQRDITSLEQRFENVKNSYLDSIATSLWDFNEPLVRIQIQGIVNLPDIAFVKVTTELGNEYQAGEPLIQPEQSVSYPILYGENLIGTLFIDASYQDIYQRLLQRAGVVIAAQFVQIFIVALCIMFVVHWLITRHIYVISAYSRSLSGEKLDRALVLDRKFKRKDELDYLVDSINEMRVKIKDDIVKLERAEDALLALNGELEVKVFDRTAKLAESNAQLQQSLENLTLAKDQLVQSEKMASLGQLVAGVAHEVNTPLGIVVTSISAMKEKVHDLERSLESEKLTRSELTNSLELFNEYQHIIEGSINKAVELIRSFKSVAVEQHSDPEVEICLAKHIRDVLTTVKTAFKGKNYRIRLEIDENFKFVTYPSAWNQILTNFLMNSHFHGFENRTEGDISIIFTVEDRDLVMEYRDNGGGIDNELRKRIFDPFVTTKRGQGGSGLGLNIVFNLVDAKLKGTVKCLKSAVGVHFKVTVPIYLHEHSPQPQMKLVK